MKTRRIRKRMLALVLVCSLTLTCSLQGVAASTSQTKSIMSLKEEEKKAQKELTNSPLYSELVATSKQAAEYQSSMCEEGKTWVDEVSESFDQNTFNEFVNEGKALAEIAATSDTTGAAELLVNFFDGIGSFFGVVDVLSATADILNLQGETVWDQIAEVAVLTAQFGIAAFSIIGLSLSFPWSLIIALILETLLQFIQRGFFDDFFADDSSDDDFEGLPRLKLQDGTNVYKPNIYIYSKQAREVSVTFGEPELLTATIPEYGEGWDVTVEGGGSGQLTDASGQTYAYLFYESVTEPSLFQMQEGWQIPADERAERFAEILSGLGFNEQEIADFEEFWTEKLEAGTDYMMYPQGTELVEQAMPLTITETPESVERIWFVFTADDGRSVAEPAGYALTRGGTDCAYYAVEWGGLIVE